MSAFRARLFSRLQDADFYRSVHHEAAGALGAGAGKTWLDVGCGPGLLTRIAAQAGYDALGVDRDPDVIDAARRLAKARGASVRFEQADLHSLPSRNERFDVVSASSLLIVLSDPARALRALVLLTKPGGKVLIVEAADAMSVGRAGKQVLSGRLGRHGSMLLLWAYVRSGRSLDPKVFSQSGLLTSRRKLLSGLVEASIVMRTR